MNTLKLLRQLGFVFALVSLSVCLHADEKTDVNFGDELATESSFGSLFAEESFDQNSSGTNLFDEPSATVAQPASKEDVVKETPKKAPETKKEAPVKSDKKVQNNKSKSADTAKANDVSSAKNNKENNTATTEKKSAENTTSKTRMPKPKVTKVASKPVEREEKQENRLTVLWAEYGDLNRPAAERRSTDVTDLFTPMINKNNQVSFLAESKNKFFGDPAPGVSKGLVIVYSVGDDIYFCQANEHEALRIPDKNHKLERVDDSDGGLHVIYAAYGDFNSQNGFASKRFFDVTKQTRGLVKGDNLTFATDSKNQFFGDPVSGWTKSFIVVYSYNGKWHCGMTSEYEEMKVPNNTDLLEEDDSNVEEPVEENKETGLLAEEE